MNQYSIEKVANAIVYFVEKDVKHFGKTMPKALAFGNFAFRDCFSRTIVFKFSHDPATIYWDI